jgi:hypothetical protein
MSFASITKFTTVFGNKRVAFGQFTQVSGDTGGAIATGFSAIDYFSATPCLTATDASGTVTITTSDPGAAQTGYWFAVGA